MKEQLGINQIIYIIVKTQIEVGTYVFGEHLPPIEDMSNLLYVSVDTIRHAYHQLQKEGYITLSKSIGTIVSVHYTDEEIEQHIQIFFSERKDTMLDICHSMPILLSGIQLAAWQNLPPEHLAELEDSIKKNKILHTYQAILYLQLVYSALKNDLLMGLIRKLNIIYMIPFLCLKDYENYVDGTFRSVPAKIECYRQSDWTALQAELDIGMHACTLSITDFYATRISVPTPEKQITFAWSSYKKASQVCYSVAFEILIMIVQGNYPLGSFLPSLKRLAMEKQVSVSTIRHSVALLNDLGIVKTINGVGTQILSMDHSAEHCNWSSTTVQKRFLDYEQSLQLIALSCRAAAAHTISAIDAESKAKWLEQLYLFERLGKLDLVFTFTMTMISKFSPYQTIRTVYAELNRQCIWGVPLRGSMGSQQTVNDFYAPYHHAMVSCLEQSDAEGYAAKLEELADYSSKVLTKQLARLGIQNVGAKAMSEYKSKNGTAALPPYNVPSK